MINMDCQEATLAKAVWWIWRIGLNVIQSDILLSMIRAETITKIGILAASIITLASTILVSVQPIPVVLGVGGTVILIVGWIRSSLDIVEMIMGHVRARVMRWTSAVFYCWMPDTLSSFKRWSLYSTSRAHQWSYSERPRVSPMEEIFWYRRQYTPQLSWL